MSLSLRFSDEDLTLVRSLKDDENILSVIDEEKKYFSNDVKIELLIHTEKQFVIVILS